MAEKTEEKPKEEAQQSGQRGRPPQRGMQRGSMKRGMRRGMQREHVFDKEAWKPKTQLGKLVKEGEVKDLDSIIDRGQRILESEIVDCLLPNIENDLLLVGQSKGKFGGGKGSIWRQTQKKTPEGNKPSFAALSVIGNKDGYVGLGFGKGKETVPAREKSNSRAKLDIIKIRRGCGSWQCNCGSPHSIPYKIEGKCGSARIVLMPAPRGTGLIVQEDCKKLIELSGIKDIHSKTFANTRSKLNLIKACFRALQKLTEMRVHQGYVKKSGIIEGKE